MAQGMISKILHIDGMTCAGCETKIERKLKGTKGIQSVNASYDRGRTEISFYPDKISLSDIETLIETLNYKVLKGKSRTGQVSQITKALGAMIILFSLYMVLSHSGLLNFFHEFPLAEAGMDYGMLFVIGLLTSVHCVSMCGGINISQCISRSSGGSAKTGRFDSIRSSLLYNLGRTISYTLVGGVVGAIGSVVSFSGAMKGIVQLAAGVFMVIMGLNMLNIFPWLRKLTPRMPKRFTRGLGENPTKKNGPLYVGLLNGLMPCGPLQAMQLYALSTGDPVKGALSMLLFSLGTIPLMFGLGAVSAILSKKYTRRIMTVGAALVVVMGVSMFQSGMLLSGLFAPSAVAGAEDSAAVQDAGDDDVQMITTKMFTGGYEPITVKAGVPVRWTIRAEKGTINGCNNEIYIPEYNITKKLTLGDNIIEFTPNQSGTFPYSCWMGMIWSNITVVE